MGSHLTDPFELIGVPARFDLDKAALEARQRELSKVLHPDRFATAGAVERRVALNKAMSVNEAVRLLKNPVARGHALLTRLLGAGADTDQLEPRVPPSFLMEVMEWREELTHAATRGDRAAVTRIASLAETRRAATVGELTRRFDALVAKQASSAVNDSDPDVSAIALGLATLKYFERLSDEVRRIEDDLSDP